MIEEAVNIFTRYMIRETDSGKGSGDHILFVLIHIY